MMFHNVARSEIGAIVVVARQGVHYAPPKVELQTALQPIKQQAQQVGAAGVLSAARALERGLVSEISMQDVHQILCDLQKAVNAAVAELMAVPCPSL